MTGDAEPDAIPLGGDRMAQEHGRLREAGGVRQVRLQDGAPAWLVTDHDQVRDALADQRLSLNKRNARGWAGFALPAELDANLLNMDPPDHTRIRRLVSQAFTPRRIQHLRPSVQRIADQLIDAFTGQPQTDLIASYAGPLPVTVICDLLGIPNGDRADFRAWTNAMLATHPPDKAAAGHAIVEMRGFLVDLIADKRRHPGDDLLTGLLAARDLDDRLSEEELTSLTFLILFAGYENSVNLIGNTVLHLLRHPDVLGALRLNADALPAVIDESMRLYPPAPVAIRRFPLRDLTIGGTVIPAGDTVLLSLAAANRDPRVFPDADSMDLGRAGRSHLALGHGIHYCVGAPLAHLEAQIAVSRLVNRLPGIALARPVEQLRWRPSFRSLGLIELPVTWH